MKRFDLSTAADQDLEEIVEFFEERSPIYVRKLLHAMTKRANLQSRLPKLGTDRGTWRSGLRSAVVDGYHVFLIWKRKRLLIARILHGSRNIGPGDFE